MFPLKIEPPKFPILRSIVLCPYCAYTSCNERYSSQGYEVVPDRWCPNDKAYEFDNDGIMSVVKVINI